MELQQFYEKVSDWLIPLGYFEIFNNHPTINPREFHFIKDGVRVVCVNAYEPYCYLHKDIINLNKSVRTVKYSISFSSLLEIHNEMKALKISYE